MHTPSQLEIIAGPRTWIGIGLTIVVALFLTFDGITKVIRIAPVLKASEELGLPQNSIVGIGILLLTCTALYALPRTSILGAILLTGYLGGAVAIHISARSGVFPVVFSLAFGVLAWLGLVLREPRLLSAIFLRQ